MSDNVVNLFEDELKHCSYWENDELDIGVATLDKSIIIVPINKDEIEIVFNGESNLYTRDKLAEFLHVASVFVDYEEKYKPKTDLVGLNYK
tara:strand:+ start:118 stop:390 length:273 start_codon:yes stop_codon:yes gene_type:complete